MIPLFTLLNILTISVPLQCEHHIHIEGTLEPAMLFSLVEKHEVTLDPAMYSTIEALEER